jgi:hypothetical protein
VGVSGALGSGTRVEEAAVAFVREAREDRRRVIRSGRKGCAGRVVPSRPGNRCVGIDEIELKLVRRVAEVTAIHHPVPLDVEADRGRVAGPIDQRVTNIVEVPYGEVLRTVRRLTRAGHAAHACRRERNRPEEPAREILDAGVEVVNLVPLSRRPNEDVQSDEAVGSLVDRPIGADKYTVHESQIGVEVVASIGAGPGSRDVGDADGAIEVGDGRRFTVFGR